MTAQHIPKGYRHHDSFKTLKEAKCEGKRLWMEGQTFRYRHNRLSGSYSIYVKEPLA